MYESSSYDAKFEFLDKGKCAIVQAYGALQEVETPRTLEQAAHEGGKIFSSKHRPPLPPKRDLLLFIYVSGRIGTRA